MAPAIARSLGSSTSTVMLAAAGFGLGAAASALFLARQTDRVGAWQALRLALMALSAALLLCAIAPHAIVLIAGQILAGLATGVAIPAIYASATAVASPDQAGRVLGIVLTGWTLSLVGGVSVSAVLADLVHWRAVFSWVAAASLGAIVACRSMSTPAVSRLDRLEDRPAPTAVEALGVPGAAPLLAAAGLFMVAFYGVFNYLGDHLHNGLGLPVSVNGLAAIVYGLGFGGAVRLNRVFAGSAATPSLPGLFLAATAVYLALALASGSPAGMMIGAFFWGLANHLTLNGLIVRLSALDPSRRGAILGLNSAVTYFAAFVGTVSFGALTGTFGFPLSICVAAGLTAIAAATAFSRVRVPASLAFSSRQR